MVKKFMRKWYCLYPILPIIYSVLTYCIMRVLNLAVQNLWEAEVVVIGKKVQIICLVVITLAAYYIIYYLCKRTIKFMKIKYEDAEHLLICMIECIVLTFATQSCLYYIATYFDYELAKKWTWIMVAMCIVTCVEWAGLCCAFLYDKLIRQRKKKKRK